MGGVVPMAAGDMGPHAFTASCFLLCCLLQGLQEGQGLQIDLLVCPWGVPWGRGARVEVGRVWRVGGVLLMAAGVWVLMPSPQHVLLLLCLLQGLQNEQGLRVGLPVAREECHGAEVRVLR